jgi:hypothetical protein
MATKPKTKRTKKSQAPRRSARPKKTAKKVAKPRRAQRTAAPRRKLDADQAELLESLKKNPHHRRLPAARRHEVEEDERVEREGETGRVFVGSDTEDDEARQLGEEFVRSATSGEEAESEMEEEAQVEEQGGPFVITTAREEFGFGSDASNPPGAEREPFPRVSVPVKPKAD